MRNEHQIELLVLSDYGSKEEIKKTNVSLQEIQSTMDNINWNHFHQVILSRNNYDWIEVGGNLNNDGLSCIYEKDNEQFVIDEAPTSVNHMAEILLSYFQDDGEFLRKNKFTGEKEEAKKKEEESKRYKDWKRKFEQESKREKKASIRKFLFASIILVLLLFSSYNWFTGELQFFGQKTEYTKAKIVNTQMQHFGKDKYFQIVTYEFDYKNQKYSGEFRAGKRIGKQEVGGLVRIKFSVANPNRSLMKGVYKN